MAAQRWASLWNRLTEGPALGPFALPGRGPKGSSLLPSSVMAQPKHSHNARVTSCGTNSQRVFSGFTALQRTVKRRC